MQKFEISEDIESDSLLDFIIELTGPNGEIDFMVSGDLMYYKTELNAEDITLIRIKFPESEIRVV